MRLGFVVALIAVVSAAQSQAQQTRQSLLNENNAVITPNGRGAITGPVLNSMLESMIVSFGVLDDINAFAPPPPAWGTNYGFYNPYVVNLNNYPISSVYANSPSALPQSTAITGAVLAPANSTDYQITGVAGFVESLAGKAAVALYGGAVQSVGSYQSYEWGINTNISNAPYGLTTGFDFNTEFGAEFDVNVYPKAGNVTPAGTVRGLLIASGSTVLPAGGAYAEEIRPYEPTGTQGWSAAIVIDGAPNTIGILLGPQGQSGSSLGSQPIQFNSVSSSGTPQVTAIQVDDFGDMIDYMPSTGGLVVQTGGVTQMSIAGGVATFDVAITIPSMQTSAGSGGLYVCIDSSGREYKKSSCP